MAYPGFLLKHRIVFNKYRRVRYFVQEGRNSIFPTIKQVNEFCLFLGKSGTAIVDLGYYGKKDCLFQKVEGGTTIGTGTSSFGKRVFSGVFEKRRVESGEMKVLVTSCSSKQSDIWNHAYCSCSFSSRLWIAGYHYCAYIPSIKISSSLSHQTCKYMMYKTYTTERLQMQMQKSLHDSVSPMSSFSPNAKPSRHVICTILLVRLMLIIVEQGVHIIILSHLPPLVPLVLLGQYLARQRCRSAVFKTTCAGDLLLFL